MRQVIEFWNWNGDLICVYSEPGLDFKTQTPHTVYHIHRNNKKIEETSNPEDVMRKISFYANDPQKSFP